MGGGGHLVSCVTCDWRVHTVNRHPSSWFQPRIGPLGEDLPRTRGFRGPWVRKGLVPGGPWLQSRGRRVWGAGRASWLGAVRATTCGSTYQGARPLPSPGPIDFRGGVDGPWKSREADGEGDPFGLWGEVWGSPPRHRAVSAPQGGQDGAGAHPGVVHPHPPGGFHGGVPVQRLRRQLCEGGGGEATGWATWGR